METEDEAINTSFLRDEEGLKADDDRGGVGNDRVREDGIL